MRRNFDTIRDLLLRIAEERELQISDASEKELLCHLELLIEAGFVVGEVVHDDSQVDPLFGHARRLTWNGHEFLESIENPSNWNKIKSIIERQSGNNGFAGLVICCYTGRQTRGWPGLAISG